VVSIAQNGNAVERSFPRSPKTSWGRKRSWELFIWTIVLRNETRRFLSSHSSDSMNRPTDRPCQSRTAKPLRAKHLKVATCEEGFCMSPANEREPSEAENRRWLVITTAADEANSSPRRKTVFVAIVPVRKKPMTPLTGMHCVSSSSSHVSKSCPRSVSAVEPLDKTRAVFERVNFWSIAISIVRV